MNLQDVESLARRMMDEHGLTDWEFGFFELSLKRRYFFPRKMHVGLCSHGGEWYDRVGRDRYMRAYHKPKISLLDRFAKVSDEQAVREILLHEIAHALLGRRARGRGKRIHDAKFKEMLLRIGGKPEGPKFDDSEILKLVTD
jgi:hypothetical protein